MNPVTAIVSTVGAAYSKRQDRKAQESAFAAQLAKAKHDARIKRIESDTARYVNQDNNDARADESARRAQRGSIKDELLTLLLFFPFYAPALDSVLLAVGLVHGTPFTAAAKSTLAMWNEAGTLWQILATAVYITTLAITRPFRMLVEMLGRKAFGTMGLKAKAAAGDARPLGARV